MTADWQDPADYQRLRRIDRAGLMWEWLRRDPGYVTWHRQASSTTRGASAELMAARGNIADWGLHFR
jgi:hypothetical protein